MNAQQRRKAYRSIKRMVGKLVNYRVGSITHTGLVVGLTDRVYNLASTSDFCMFDGSRPSVHRVRVKLPSGSHQSPRLSKLTPVAA